MKRPISVTLSPENLLWLRARATHKGYRSVSETLDRVVAEARASYADETARSVAGTIAIAADDPGLETADGAVRALFEDHVAAPEGRAASRTRARQSGRAKGSRAAADA